MSDVDITDILLAIARQVASSLKQVEIDLEPPFFIQLFNGIAETNKSLQIREIKASFLEGLIEMGAALMM